MGKRKRKRGKSEDQEGGIVRVRLPEDGEVLGQVVATLGAGLLQVRCTDEKVRKVNIPGKFRKRMWTRVGDVVALMPQYGLDPENKGSLVYRYSKNDANTLYSEGLIPEEYLM